MGDKANRLEIPRRNQVNQFLQAKQILFFPNQLSINPTTNSLMPKVIAEKWPLSEDNRQVLPKIDYADTFSTTNQLDTLKEVTLRIFGTTPGWIKFLFGIRNAVAGLFGLQNKMPKDYHESFQVGGYVKFFRIYSLSPDQVVMGANDKHLNFRAIVANSHSPQYNIKVTTLVQFNNRMGRIYFAIIKPFHGLVVRRMVRNGHRHPDRE